MVDAATFLTRRLGTKRDVTVASAANLLHEVRDDFARRRSTLLYFLGSGCVAICLGTMDPDDTRLTLL